LKTKIREVFNELEKEGYLARINYFCRLNCADTALDKKATGLAEKGKIVKGIVHYNEQDEKNLWKNGSVCLCYRALNGTGDSSTLVKELGEHIVEKFENAGAIVDWDGDPDRAICLYAW